MKVIKLNRRYKMYEYGFTHAFRWERWEFNDIRPYERSLINLYGVQSYDYQRSSWISVFGSSTNKKTGYKPYYLYVRGEPMLTATLLGAGV